MPWIILIFFLFLLDLYVYQAFKLFIKGLSPAWETGLSIAYWMVPVLLIILLLMDQFIPDEPNQMPGLVHARAFMICLYLPKLLALPILLIDDVRRGIFWLINNMGSEITYNPSRSRFLTTTGFILGSIPFVALVYGMIRNPYRYKVFRTKLPIKSLPEALEGLKIVQISDIHTGSFTYKEPVKESVKLINELEPDLVFFTGDLVNDRTEEALDYIDVFEKITAKHGVFSVLGNHDYGDYASWPNAAAKAENLEAMKEVHRRLGWDLLNNENRSLTIQGEKVEVIGVENFSAKGRFPKYGKLDQACVGCEKDASLRLLLSHDPSHWEYEVVPKYPEIQITFSGHTHGMQFGVEIPGWVKWSPIRYVYKQWAGLYQQGDQYLYVNRGLGFIGYPGRVGILPEITLLELTSDEKRSES